MDFREEARLRREIRHMIQWAEAFHVPEDEIADRIEKWVVVQLDLDPSEPEGAERQVRIQALIEEMLASR